MKSIIQADKTECFLCGRNGYADPLDEHHIFAGPNRKHSEEDGMKVYLCHSRCHIFGKQAAHACKKTDQYLKREAQTVWEHKYGDREAFRARYGRSYL